MPRNVQNITLKAKNTDVKSLLIPLMVTVAVPVESHAEPAGGCMKIRGAMQRCMRRGLTKLAAFALVALAGCGGGGGSDSATSNPPPTPAVPALGEMTLLAGAYGGSGNTDGAPGRFSQPGGVAIDAAGNVYVADTANHTVRKITASGVITLAGQSGIAGNVDGIGAVANFSGPVAVAVDLAGNVYVADQGNSEIRKITPAGMVTTLARTASSGVAVDATGTVFVAEQNQVRKITPEGVVSSLAAGFNSLSSLALDRAGNIYVTDSGASLIRKISSSGVVTTIAGTSVAPDGTAAFGFADGGLGVAKFDHPSAIVVDSDGMLYVLDNQRIRKATPEGFVTSLAVTNADATRFLFPGGRGPGLAISADGSIFFSVPADNVVKKMTPSRSVVDVAGTPAARGTADGNGAAARFSGTGQLAIDTTGNIIVIDALNNSIRKITPSGVVTTTAANIGVRKPLAYDFPGSVLLLGLAIERSGTLLVADPFSHLIRRIGADGASTIAAGSAWPDGLFTGGFFGFLAGRSDPVGVALDSAGSILVPDNGFLHAAPGGGIIRKITSAGVDSILACSDRPTCLQLGKGADSIALDSTGNIYVAQYGSISKITPSGTSSILAGNGVSGFRDGTGSEASFGGENGGGVIRGPSALTVDAAGNVFVADTYNNAIRKITPAGVVTTVAGKAGSTGVILGTLPASLSAPAGIAIDAAGVLYVSSENAVLRIKP